MSASEQYVYSFGRRLVKPISFVLFAAVAMTTHAAAAADASGTWEMHGPAESGAWLKTRQSDRVVRFQLELTRGAPSYNSGWIEGEFNLSGDVGVFRRQTESGLCEIGFQFESKRVTLRQMGYVQGCSFGANVYAHGVLLRTASTQPVFSDGDPRFGK